jgi:lipopolysaccharide transport system permease protein
MHSQLAPQDIAAPLDIRPRRVIEPSNALRGIDFPELWEYRSLIGSLVARHLQVRYAQTVIGVGWALFRPLISMIVFTIVFQKFARIPSDGRPYEVFSLAAIVPWTYFSSAVSSATESLSGSASMITKVYFPRLVLPVSFVVAPLVDLAVGMVMLLVMLLWYNIAPSLSSIAIIPLLVLAMMLTATGVGCALTALDIQYRDLRHLVPFALQMWMYASPVVYPIAMVPDRYRQLYMLNPMAGIISAFRSSLLATDPPDWPAITASLVTSAALCTVGVVYFRHRERVFADVV